MDVSVWKFPLLPQPEQVVRMPRGGVPMCVQVQHGDPCLWAMVNIDAPQSHRIVRIVGTGHQCSDCAADQYVGTYQLEGGALVFHVFIGDEPDDR